MKRASKKALTPRQALIRSIVIDECRRLVALAIELGATKAELRAEVRSAGREAAKDRTLKSKGARHDS